MSTQPTEPKVLPIVPLKGTVLFPHLLMPISVGRPRSRAAIEAALGAEEQEILILTQRDPEVEVPNKDDLFTLGTLATIVRVARPSDGLIQVLVQGEERGVLIKIEENDPYLQGRVISSPLEESTGTEIEALQQEVLKLLNKVLSFTKSEIPVDLYQMVASQDSSAHLVYLAASFLSLDVAREQALLESATLLDALRLLHSYLTHEIKVLDLRHQISSEAEGELKKQHRDYLLRQQMESIQRELGEGDESSDTAKLGKRLEEAQLPEEALKTTRRELKRLQSVPTASPEHHIIRTYIETVLDLPWNEASDSDIDIAGAREVLDEDHYGLQEIKERIVEHLAVLKSPRSPILCFVGPPGVGKTSLGQSIARAMGRKFERISLGGMHDEAELRGHRRTYIGAMPGRILQALRRAGVKNPVLMLDEVDKLGRDFCGDPAAALLEILDPEQNLQFRDNFLDLPFNLSEVFFITTANSLETIPEPLRDRMEIVRLSGYSDEEKIEIARRYLLPRLLEDTGLKPEQWTIEDSALARVVSHYTREAGVRRLQQQLGKLIRKVALRFVEKGENAVSIDDDGVAELLGVEKFFQNKLRRDLPTGVAPGLAWTQTGGEVLYIEATLLPEGNGLTLTGQLGDVMRESAKTAQSYVWSHARELGIDTADFKNNGLHIHVPAGAIPKDGPSAGITMAAALASLYSNQVVDSRTAMTGEITLTGLVLPVGGIKEKVLGARRAGMKRLILSKENRRDIDELEEDVRNALEFIYVEKAEEVLEAAIVKDSDVQDTDVSRLKRVG